MARYLYNDREAPDINTIWPDKETYRYACITRSRSNGAAGTSVLFSSAPFIVEVRIGYGTDIPFGVVLSNGTTIKQYYNPRGTDVWSDFGDFEPHIGNAIGEQVIHWANAKVYAEDGSVFMTASSDPVPVPTIYLYNGVKLPKLPDWDKDTYPYALMVRSLSSSSDSYVLYCSTTPIHYKYTGTGIFAGYRPLAEKDGTAIAYSVSILKSNGAFFNDSTGDVVDYWPRHEALDKQLVGGETFTESKTRFWANYNVLDIDSKDVLLAMSQPTPFFASAPIEPNPTVIGMIVGRHLASLRYKRPLEAGLYETGTRNLIYSWEQLTGDEILSGGVVKVTDGVVTSGWANSFATLTNKSSKYLTGDLVLPSNAEITSLGSSAFRKCLNLTSITIPDGVTNIGVGAFNGCSVLKSVNLPNSITSMGKYNPGSGTGTASLGVFEGCKALEKVALPSNLTVFGDKMFCGCENLTSVTIPDGVTALSTQAFDNCGKLTSINIPSNVTVIGISAFTSCVGLTEISFPDSVTQIKIWAFEGCTNLASVHIGSGMSDIYNNPFHWCPNVKSITISTDNTVYHVHDNNLIHTADKILVIGCNNNIPSDGSVITLGTYAYDSRAQLTEVVIPDCVTTIEDYAFYNNPDLTTIHVGSGVTAISYPICGLCPNLSRFTVSESNTVFSAVNGHLVETASKILFTGGTSPIPDDGSVTSIKAHAFFGRSITSITIPDCITEIGVRAFCSCTQLSSVTYTGTVAQWNAMTLGNDWCDNTLVTQVVCSDGTVSITQ